MLAAILAVMGLTLTVCGVLLWMWGGTQTARKSRHERRRPDLSDHRRAALDHRIAVTAAGIGFLLGAMFSSLHRKSLRSYDRNQARVAPSG